MLHSFVFSAKAAAVGIATERRRQAGQTPRVQSVERIQTDVVEVHGVGMGVVSDIVVHGTVVHAAFPFGLPDGTAATDRFGIAAVASPLQQPISIAIAPGLAVTAIA